MRVMHHHHRIALLGAAAATLAVTVAHAQQATPTPTPVPRSSTIFSPAIGNFSLRPSGEQSQPQPQPTLPVRVAAPTPTPSPAARATPTPTRSIAQPALRPASPQTGAIRVTPTPAPSVTPTPSPIPQTDTTSAAAPTPAATTPATVSTPVPVQPGEAGLPWLWMLLGAVLATAIAAGGWLLGRRSRPAPKAETPAPVVERPAPAPAPGRAPQSPPPPVIRPVPAAPVEPIAIEFHPLGIQVGDKGAVLEFEMGLLNASGASAEGLRVSLLLASANPDQDALIANFHTASGLPAAGPPVDLPAGEGGRIPGKLAIESERIHVVQVGGRPMFVPIVLIDLRWRGGLSVRRHGADFMIGTAGQGAGQGGKLGPIWLDRGAQRLAGLAASRYLPQARPVAA